MTRYRTNGKCCQTDGRPNNRTDIRTTKQSDRNLHANATRTKAGGAKQVGLNDPLHGGILKFRQGGWGLDNMFLFLLVINVFHRGR